MEMPLLFDVIKGGSDRLTVASMMPVFIEVVGTRKLEDDISMVRVEINTSVTRDTSSEI